MNELNSKRLENYIQEAKKVLLETEMLSYSIKNRSIKLKLSENVIPNLINFITYLEVKRFDRKEINFYISQCLNELNEIAEYNKQIMLLTSKYKIIKEDANLIVDLKQ
ncbi:MAG: hypothetical protein ACJ0G3_03595 [Dehalococcoidia bacterium]|tara:strand:- start:726 stop:1049 length:324 start_codon:yes stop_codon:yes gene_type:complete